MATQSEGRKPAIATRIMELAMALPPGSVLPGPAALARQLEVGEATVYQARSALTARGALLYTDPVGWGLSPQQRLRGQESVTRTISGHWLVSLPAQKRVHYFVVDVTRGREVAVFAANAGGQYGGPGAVVSDHARDCLAVAEGAFTAIRDAAASALERGRSMRTQTLGALIHRSPTSRTVTVCVAGPGQSAPGWFAYWEAVGSGGFAVVRHVHAGDDDDGGELILVEPADRQGVPLGTPPVSVPGSDRKWLEEIDRGCFPAIERAIGQAVGH